MFAPIRNNRISVRELSCGTPSAMVYLIYSTIDFPKHMNQTLPPASAEGSVPLLLLLAAINNGEIEERKELMTVPAVKIQIRN